MFDENVMDERVVRLEALRLVWTKTPDAAAAIVEAAKLVAFMLTLQKDVDKTKK